MKFSVIIEIYLYPDAPKLEVPELDGLGLMEDVTTSLGNFLSRTSREIKCVESIIFSSFNPPPSHRRWTFFLKFHFQFRILSLFIVLTPEPFLSEPFQFNAVLWFRLVGDLIYLDAVTLEGNTFCITGTTKNFYVNSSSGNILDPRPGKAAAEATTIVGLLQKISSKFKKGIG